MNPESMTQNVVEVPVRGAGGEDRGYRKVEVSKIDGRVRFRLLKEAVVMYRANQRVGTHSTKTRAEVAGSNKKPWRQKGTGRARAGTRKSPLWRGGGVVFGPHPRDYSYAIHRKQRRLAVRSALLSKFLDGEVVIVEGLDVEEPKTKLVASALRALGVERSCLIGTKGVQRKLVLAARNIPGVQVAPVSDFNALDVLRAHTILLTSGGFEELLRLASAEGRRSEGGAGPAEAAAPPSEVPAGASSPEREEVREEGEAHDP